MKKETWKKVLQIASTIIGMIIGFLGGEASAEVVFNNLIK